MSHFETLLSVAIIGAAALQVVVLYALYRVVAQLAQRTEKLLTTIEPELNDLATGVRAVRRALEFSTTEIQATLAGVRATTEELNAMIQAEGSQVARVVGTASAAAERQIYEMDRALDHARERVAEIGEGFDRAVLDPARTILAVAMGVRRAIEALARRPKEAAEKGPAPDPWSDPAPDPYDGGSS